MKHGASRRSLKTPLYVTWQNMKRRCLDPNRSDYAYYGAKGITVCARWRTSFEAFRDDMGPRPSPSHQIDRVDSSGNYEPDNCRWATRVEQMQNRAVSRLLTFNGETMTVASWARRVGIDRATLRHRLARKIPPGVALAMPVRPQARRAQ